MCASALCQFATQIPYRSQSPGNGMLRRVGLTRSVDGARQTWPKKSGLPWQRQAIEGGNTHVRWCLLAHITPPAVSGNRIPSGYLHQSEDKTDGRNRDGNTGDRSKAEIWDDKNRDGSRAGK